MNKSNVRRMLAGGLLVLGGIGSSAHAGPITGGEWYRFFFGSAVSPATSAIPEGVPGGPAAPGGTPPWTFTAPASGATFRVTDGFTVGDVFRVFIDSVDLGLTSAPSVTGSCSGPDACYADPDFSKGTYGVGPGLHSVEINIEVNAPFTGSGGSFMRWDVTGVTAVPEPGSLALLGLGLLGLGIGRRKS